MIQFMLLDNVQVQIKMNKFLSIIFVSLLLSGNAYAEKKCSDNIEFDWKILPNDSIGYDYRKGWVKGPIRFKFKNPTSKTIKITYVALKTKDKEIIIEEKNHDLIIDPFTKFKSISIEKGSLMTELAEFGSYRCEYASAGTTSKKTYKKKNSPQTKVNKNRLNDDFNTWWGIVIVGVIMGLFFLIANFFDPIDGKNRKKNSKVKEKSMGENIIGKVWSGGETMSKTFWIYCILVTLSFSIMAGILSSTVGSYLFIIPVIIIIWSNIGLWNSSTKYKLAQLDKKESYGWATAAKVFVVLNFIGTLSQAGFIFRGF
jgi:hypothetical protein